MKLPQIPVFPNMFTSIACPLLVVWLDSSFNGPLPSWLMFVISFVGCLVIDCLKCEWK